MPTSEDWVKQGQTRMNVWSARLSFYVGKWVLIVVVSHDQPCSSETGSVNRKLRLTPESWLEVFPKFKVAWTDGVVEAITMEEIPAELILWDQTGIKLVPCSSWTMEKQGQKRVEMVGVNGKGQITAVLCATLLSDSLPIQLIYKGKTTVTHGFPSHQTGTSPTPPTTGQLKRPCCSM